MMMFSGFGVNLRDIPSYLEWGTHVSFFRYALEGYVEAVYGFARRPFSCYEVYCYYKFPEHFLKTIAMTKIDIWFSMEMLLLTLILTKILGYFTLSWKVKVGRWSSFTNLFIGYLFTYVFISNFFNQPIILLHNDYLNAIVMFSLNEWVRCRILIFKSFPISNQNTVVCRYILSIFFQYLYNCVIYAIVYFALFTFCCVRINCVFVILRANVNFLSN